MASDARYTHGHHESVLRSHTWRTAENSAAYLLPHLTAGMSLLDVGAGPGTITVDLARLLSPGRVVGLDASEEVTEKATRHAADEGVETVEFVVGDAYALPFGDDTFDVVHAHQVLQHLADPVAALREFRRVVKPGGIVAARDVDYGATVFSPELPGLVAWLDLYHEVARSNAGDPDAGRSLKAWAMAAGFTEVETTASLWCFASDEEREWWGSSWADRATESAFGSRALEIGAATPDDLQAIRSAWLEWADAPTGVFAFPHFEVIARG